MTFICLHFLGGSAQTWSTLAQYLFPEARVLAIDLPGFGAAAAIAGETLSDAANLVAERIRAEALGPYTLIGHSMGAKIAAVLARRAEDGEAGLEGLSRIVLLAGSPPAPEPMDEDKRQEMLGWFTGSADQAEAEAFIVANVSRPLPPDLHAATVADVLRADPARWRAWFMGGSREDWSAHVGLLRTPALVVAGADDPYLGPDGQARCTMPHFASAELVTLPDTKHLLPLERPRDIADFIKAHAP